MFGDRPGTRLAGVAVALLKGCHWQEKGLQMRKILAIIPAVFLVGFATSTHAEVTLIEKSTMKFSKCRIQIDLVGLQLGIEPITIIDTNSLKIVRFQTNDGSGDSILATCSKPDRTFVLQLSTE
ncbi:MAG: hypothetical protein J4F49_06085 [Rhodobacteraceae bacterium]|nr:hypothetical protein [Paracoccaceae bacterium]